MTYRIEKVDDGMEALLLMATVRDNVVDLDWPHDEDDAGSYAQRCLAKVKTIGEPNASYPPQTAFLMMRLYRRGEVFVSGMSSADGYPGQAIGLAEEAALGIYDEVHPEVAVAAKALVEESVEEVKRFAADDALPILAAKLGEQLAPDQFLSHLLEKAKVDLRPTHHGDGAMNYRESRYCVDHHPHLLDTQD